MSLKFVNGTDWVRSIKAGCIKLEHNRDKVDLLNVFPVPDGDTGTNMYLTLLSAVKEAEKNIDKPLGNIAKAASKGSLMGARGNSGVIMSQVFRGIAKVLDGKDVANAEDIASALKAGSDTAYKAVMKPVEGTILTVVREVAKACEEEAAKQTDIVACLLVAIQRGYDTLEKTPLMLPVLKEAGVVDAGGQGLLYFLEGMLEGLARQKDVALDDYKELIYSPEVSKPKADISLEFQYCTELLIIDVEEMDLEDVRDHLGPLGDSMVVVGDDDIVKVHIHSNHPGKVLETCLQWGALNDIKINNMLEEVHEHRNNWEPSPEPSNSKKIGLVSVGVGSGITEILGSLGVDIVVEGGQTMNPSTEDLLNACNSINAESIIILPNNSNIIMAAQQVSHLIEGKKVSVVPTKSVMQAVTALIAFDDNGNVDEVALAMSGEIEQVKYAEITHAVRDSSINGLDISDGDVIGIIGGKISLVAEDIESALLDVIDKMADDDELITIFYGIDVTEDAAFSAKAKIIEKYPDYEVEVHYGGQPHYNYLVAVE
ncbi:MAG: DAK2 domain-containing protein [Syntrophomonadaceae bacterium]|nr:DAK2 domain-containing protein [Syntrophomonadaceae bacterium]